MTTREALESERAQLEALLDDDRHVEATPAATVREERARLRELRHLLQAETTAPVTPPEPPPSQRVGLWEPLPLYATASRPPPADVQPQPDSVHPVLPPSKPQAEPPATELSAQRASFSRAVAEALEARRNRKATRKRLAKLIEACPQDLWCLRVLGAALEAVDGSAHADPLRAPVQALGGSLPGLFSLRPFGPLGPFSGGSHEPPDSRGVTATQELLLRTLAELGSPGTAVDVESVTWRVRESCPELDAATVQKALVSLAHPARRRFPLVDALGLIDRNAPERTRVKRVGLSTFGRQFLAGSLPFPQLLVNGFEYAGVATPPFNASEVFHAAIEILNAELELRRELHLASFVHGPDLPTGGELRWSASRRWGSWSGYPERYVVSAAVELEVDAATQRSRLRARELPWPMTAREVIARAQQLELPGLESISDESTCEGQEVLLEFQHVAFAVFAERAFVHCDVASQASPEPFHLQPSIGALVHAFVDSRRAEAMARVEQSLAVQDQAVERAEGVVKAVRFLDDVLGAMRTHDDEVEGLLGLRFEEAQFAPLALARSPDRFTELQAQHVASIRRLASRTLESAFRDWREAVSRLEELRALASPAKIASQVREELLEAAQRFQSPRRTRIVHEPA